MNLESVRSCLYFVCLASALAIALSLSIENKVHAQPNVLFIVADDLNCAIGPYNDPIAHTPHLDRLASRGLTFRRAYCQQAVCNPSRSSFLTGLRPSTVGVDDLRKYFRDTAESGESLVTLPQHFKNHGYFCQNIGKLFHNMGETQDRQSWSIDEVLHNGTHAADTIYSNSTVSKEQRQYKSPVTEAFDVPDIVYRDGQIANLASAMLRDHPIGRQPFFLAVGFWRPHLPFVAPRKYWDLYDPASIRSPTPPSPPIDAPTIAMHASREIKGYGKVPKDRSFNAEETRHFRHGYYASISFLDSQVGEILDALDESGHANNTIVVFTSDHGFHIGEKTLWGKTSNFEQDARVPLIIASPDHIHSHGLDTNGIVELIDLFPTLSELGGVANDQPKNLEGVSQAPLLRSPSTSVKSFALTQHEQPFYGPRSKREAMGYSIRTASWRYTEWRSLKDSHVMARELYDHETDPFETKNLAPGRPNIVTKMASKLNMAFGLSQ
ncbi:MAG: sulfatase [Planctomycetota bacterium]